MKQICLLGSTGQIGTRVLDVLRGLKGYRVHSLVARSSWEKVLEQIKEFRPAVAVLLDEDAAKRLKKEYKGPTRVESGRDAMLAAVEAREASVVYCAIAGAAGLMASHRAVQKGKVLALANKESIIMAGELLTGLAKKTGSSIVPVDSEHSAIFQCLHSGKPKEIRRLIITASGGPFRTFSREQMEQATPEQALKHPTWQMGPKITIDSATLMNKALEIIEARYLFGVDPSAQIEVVVHPQSVIHSMVEFVDGSMMAQMSLPDMRIPIQYALTYPDRAPAPYVQWLDLAKLKSLTFEAPDPKRFPTLNFGFDVAKAGGTSGACLNGADEIAIDHFLNGRIRFTQIFDAIEHALSAHRVRKHPSLDEIIQADAWAREEVNRFLQVDGAALERSRRA